jgi:hypothetical protein
MAYNYHSRTTQLPFGLGILERLGSRTLSRWVIPDATLFAVLLDFAGRKVTSSSAITYYHSTSSALQSSGPQS